MLKKWKVSRSEIAFHSPWFTVQKDKITLPHSGENIEYYVWTDHDIVQIVPITSDGKILLEKQYKHGVADVTIELPAGYVESDEPPLVAAKRELREETGYEAGQFTYITRTAHNPSKYRSWHYVYVANNIVKKHDKQLDSTEDIEIFFVTMDEALQMVRDKYITATSTIASLFMVHDRWKDLFFHV